MSLSGSRLALLIRTSLYGCLFTGLGCGVTFAADDIQFNTDILDLKDRSNIDLDRFSRKGYIMPGEYTLALRVNGQSLQDQQIPVYASESDPKDSRICLTHDIVPLLALKPEYVEKLTWWRNGQCLDMASLPGMEARANLGDNSLAVTIPQAYLEYSSEGWDPPSRWDNGIPGVLMDYNVNVQNQHNEDAGTDTTVSGNGTVGANIGAWRLRADWQMRHNPDGDDYSEGDKFNWEWSRYYMYRPLPSIGAKLTLGEDYLNSDIFDSLRFVGGSIASDDNMLPPNLRGYAPEVTGVANSNAKVTISQQGRVIYETQVAAGPFRIQDLSEAVSGKLDVRIEEQSGRVQTYQVDTADVPYLTRPGQVRYKFAAGRPTGWEHETDGPTFATGEFSWGINNGWSLFGGGVGSQDYNAVALGVGRDLLAFGAISFDVTQSIAEMQDDEKLRGRSYRVNYSKRFDETNSQVTLAGYRFSEEDYMSMSEFLDAENNEASRGRGKELYTLTFSQNFENLGLTASLNYSHETYWDRSPDDRYNLSLSHTRDIADIKNVSFSLTAYRNSYNGLDDDGLFFSVSVPFGNGASVSYETSVSGQDNTNNVRYYDRIGEHDSYQLSTGYGRHGAAASGYYTHEGTVARMNASASYQEGRYSSVSASMQGGMTATAEGAALHRSNVMGGTRMLLDTDGVPDVPVKGYGSSVESNWFGKAVVADVSSYYRSKMSVDLDNMPDNAEATESVVQGTLTEGAIGYRRFKVISGQKAMAVIRLSDGTYPPFGSTVSNEKQQDVGIVNDEGQVYLSGINPGESMKVKWGESTQCELKLPQSLPSPELTSQSLLLPCTLARTASVNTKNGN